MDLTELSDELGLSEDKRKLLAYPLDEAKVEPLPAARIPRRASAGPALLSFAQQRLWILDQLQPGAALYNIAGAVRLRGALDVGVLRRSLAALLRRHETLRTTFSSVGGQPVQRIALARGWRLPIADLAGLPAAQRLARDEARTPFDLARGPLIRTTLLCHVRAACLGAYAHQDLPFELLEVA